MKGKQPPNKQLHVVNTGKKPPINSYMWWTQVFMKGKKPPNKQLHVENTGVHEG